MELYYKVNLEYKNNEDFYIMASNKKEAKQIAKDRSKGVIEAIETKRITEQEYLEMEHF